MRPPIVLAPEANIRQPARPRAVIVEDDELVERRTMARIPDNRAARVSAPRSGGRTRNRSNGSRVGEFRVGKYQVVKRLHKGRIAHVMLAKTRGIGGLERSVAVKVLRSSFARDQRFVNSFLHEERVTGSLHHPQMIRLLDSGESDYGPFMALEYVPGWSLARVLEAAIADDRPVPLSVAMCLAHGVASGLHYLHELLRNQDQRIRMVHRDVQPANIMVTESGHIKLIDFGNVTIEGMERDQPNLLSVVGPYTPPEVMERKNVDRRADIYSLGALVYKLTTGYEPTPCDDSSDILPPSARCANYAGDLEDLVMRMLHPDVDRRWQSAASVLLAFEELASRYGFALSHREVARYVDGLMSKRAADKNQARSGARRMRTNAPHDEEMNKTRVRMR